MRNHVLPLSWVLKPFCLRYVTHEPPTRRHVRAALWWYYFKTLWPCSSASFEFPCTLNDNSSDTIAKKLPSVIVRHWKIVHPEDFYPIRCIMWWITWWITCSVTLVLSFLMTQTIRAKLKLTSTVRLLANRYPVSSLYTDILYVVIQLTSKPSAIPLSCVASRRKPVFWCEHPYDSRQLNWWAGLIWSVFCPVTGFWTFQNQLLPVAPSCFASFGVNALATATRLAFVRVHRIACVLHCFICYLLISWFSF